MADTTNTNLQFTEEQLQNLVTLILRSVNTRIQERIVDTVTAGDTKHAPSADAVQKAILAMNHWQTSVVTGTLPETGDATTIYLQRDTEEDTTWVLNIYANDQWIPIGDTNFDLDNYFAKDSVIDVVNALFASTDFKNKLLTDATGTNLDARYAKLTDIPDIEAAKTAVLNDVAAAYVSTDSLNTTLSGYVAEDDLNTTLASYWSNSTEDITALKTALGIDNEQVATDAKITEIVNAAFAASAPDLT